MKSLGVTTTVMTIHPGGNMNVHLQRLAASVAKRPLDKHVCTIMSGGDKWPCVACASTFEFGRPSIHRCAKDMKVPGKSESSLFLPRACHSAAQAGQRTRERMCISAVYCRPSYNDSNFNNVFIRYWAAWEDIFGHAGVVTSVCLLEKWWMTADLHTDLKALSHTWFISLSLSLCTAG